MANLRNIPGQSALRGLPETSAPCLDGSAGATIIRDTGVSDKINLRASPDNMALRRAVKRSVGTDLPLDANTFAAAGDRMVIWLGPDEWMIMAENGAAPSIIAECDTPEAGHVAATDVSDAIGAVTMKGPHVRAVLAKHCGLDFHHEAFTPGMAQQSLLSHAGVTIACLKTDCFLVIGRSSFMPYIVALMQDASIEFGFDYHAA
ncbi:sarcosine oxidase subunit gamma [Alphaproteobacteria bacterium LSUCC0684]